MSAKTGIQIPQNGGWFSAPIWWIANSFSSVYHEQRKCSLEQVRRISELIRVRFEIEIKLSSLRLEPALEAAVLSALR